jgi:hypothetical protein
MLKNLIEDKDDMMGESGLSLNKKKSSSRREDPRSGGGGFLSGFKQGFFK